MLNIALPCTVALGGDKERRARPALRGLRPKMLSQN